MISAVFPYQKKRRNVLGRRWLSSKWARRRHHAATRQSNVFLPLAQRVAVPRATRSLHRSPTSLAWVTPDKLRQRPLTVIASLSTAATSTPSSKP